MYTTALRMVNSRVDAEHIRQESFISAFASISDFQNQTSFFAWLKRIVINKSIDWLRKRKPDITKGIESADVPEDQHSVDQIPLKFSTNEVINSIQRLPDSYRTILNLYLIDGMDKDEIAQLMGVSVRTVQTQYLKAKYVMLSKLKDLKPNAFNEDVEFVYYGDDLYTEAVLDLTSPPATIEDLKTQSRSKRLTAMEKLELARNGVTKIELEQFKEEAALDYDTLAQGLAVGRATLLNLKGDQKFKFAVSEKIVGLIDIYSYGYEVFGNKANFNNWMLSPNKAINGQKPFDLIDNQFGREEVSDLIGRIEHGIYS